MKQPAALSSYQSEALPLPLGTLSSGCTDGAGCQGRLDQTILSCTERICGPDNRPAPPILWLPGPLPEVTPQIRPDLC